MYLRPLRLLPPLLLALGLTPALPRLALAQSTSLSWQCQTPAEHPPSGTQCPVNSSTPLPVTTTPDPTSLQDVNITEVGGNAVTTTLPVSGTVTANQGTAGGTPWPVSVQPDATSASGVAPSASSALAANLVVKASAGNLYAFEVSADSTLSASAWWIMIYNATAAPADGAVTPAKCYAMPAGTTVFSAGWGAIGAYFSTGITIGVSTAGCFTKTASTHAFISGEAK